MIINRHFNILSLKSLKKCLQYIAAARAHSLVCMQPALFIIYKEEGDSFNVQCIAERVIPIAQLIAVHIEMRHLVFPCIPVDIGRNGEKNHIAVLQLFLKCLQVRDLLATWSAPARPKVYIYIFALERRELDNIAVSILKHYP